MPEFGKSDEMRAARPETTDSIAISSDIVFEALGKIAAQEKISTVEVFGNTNNSHIRNGWPRALAYALCKRFSQDRKFKERDFHNITRMLSVYHAVLSGTSLLHNINKNGTDYMDFIYKKWPEGSVIVRDQLIGLAEQVVATLPSLEDLEKLRRG